MNNDRKREEDGEGGGEHGVVNEIEYSSNDEAGVVL